MSDYQGQRPAWTIWNHNKLRLQGEKWEGEKGRPSLHYKMVNNNPRFNIYPNKEGQSKPVPFAADFHISNQVFELVKMVAAETENSRYSFSIKAMWQYGKKLDQPTVVSKIIVGRDSTGVIYIAFQERNKDLYKFPFLPSFFAEIEDSNGEPLNKAAASNLVAIAWATGFQNMTAAYMVVEGKEPPKRDGGGYNGGGGNGGGGYNKGGNSGGGNSGGGNSGGGDSWGASQSF